MTDEKPDDGYAKFRAAHDAYCAAHPAEVAEIDARSDAMQARVKTYELALADYLTAIKELRETKDGILMLTRIAGVIALEQLHSAALGIRSVPSWQEALERHDVLTSATIGKITGSFQQEASN